jgi:hypothetical protein
MSYTLPGNAFTDFDSETIACAPTPAGVTYSAATRTFSGTPTAPGTVVTSVICTATDKYGVSSTTPLTISMTTRSNTAPVFVPAALPN